MSTEDVLKQFQDESAKIQFIVLNRPPSNWEYLLAAELLASRLAPISLQYEAFDKGVDKRVKINDEKRFISWSASLCDELSDIQSRLERTVGTDLDASFGPPGKPGNPIKIKRTVEMIVELANRLLATERDIRSLRPPRRFDVLQKKMEGITSAWFDQIVSLKDGLMKLSSDLENKKAIGDFHIPISFAPPRQVVEMSKEVRKLKATAPVTRQKSFTELRRDIFGETQATTSKSVGRRSSSDLRTSMSLFTRLLRILK
jgi:hypothetical protein